MDMSDVIKLLSWLNIQEEEVRKVMASQGWEGIRALATARRNQVECAFNQIMAMKLKSSKTPKKQMSKMEAMKIADQLKNIDKPVNTPTNAQKLGSFFDMFKNKGIGI